MPWRTTSVMDQRIRFIGEAVAGSTSFAELCSRYGISRTTGYRWLQRYYEAGSFQALSERSRRPHHSPTRTPAKDEARVIALRKRHGWGARKLKELLKNEGLDMPEITIHRIIRRNGLIPPANSHSPATKRFERSQPNELWQMDFKGYYSLAQDRCYPLSILDDNSRFAVGLYALFDQKGGSVNACMVKTFEHYGVPDAMLMDHGIPWWSTTNGYGLTWVSIDLIKQGIALYFGKFRHPQTQGKVERFNRTLGDAVSHRGRPRRRSRWPAMLDEIRDEYNYVRPHEALQMDVPASRYEPSDQSRPSGNIRLGRL